MTDEKYTEHRQRIIDASRETNFALWNALLTFDGILISVFSAVAIFDADSKLLASSLVVLSIISATLLVMNFMFAQYSYRLLGSATTTKLTNEFITATYEKVSRKRKWCDRRERWCYLILGIDALIVLILVFLKSA